VFLNKFISNSNGVSIAISPYLRLKLSCCSSILVNIPKSLYIYTKSRDPKNKNKNYFYLNKNKK